MAIDLLSVGVTTSEGLIQKLRGAVDPIPFPASAGTISKIDLALLAWKQSRDPSPSTAVHIPQVSSLLLNWILDVFNRAVKTASKASSHYASPLNHPAYYTLLGTLLEDAASSTDGNLFTSQASLGSSPQTPLLLWSALLRVTPRDNRNACISAGADPLMLLLQPVLPSLVNGSTATTSQIDQLFHQVFLTAASFTESDVPTAQGIVKLLAALQGPWLEAASENATLAQRTYSAFTEASLVPWSEAMCKLEQFQSTASCHRRHLASPFSVLRRHIAQIGEGVFAGGHAVQGVIAPPSSSKDSAQGSTLLQAIEAAKDNDSVVHLIPQLALASIQTCRSRVAEFQQVARGHIKKGIDSPKDDSNMADESGDKTQETVNVHLILFANLIAPLIHMVSAIENTEQSAQTLEALLQVLLNTKLAASISQAPLWLQILAEVISHLLDIIAKPQSDAALICSIAAIRTIWSIDESILMPRIQDTLQVLCAQRSRDGPETSLRLQNETQLFLEDLLQTHAKTQDTPQLLQSLGAVFQQSSHSQWNQTSIFNSRRLNAALSTSVKNSISPPQVVQTLQDLSTLLNTIASRSASQEAKKRSSPDHDQSHSYSVINILRFAHPVLASIPLPPAMLEEVRPQIRSILEALSTLFDSCSAALKETTGATPTKKAKKGSPSKAYATNTHKSQSAEAAAACLWAYYGLAVGLKGVDVASGREDFPETSSILESLSSSRSPLIEAAQGQSQNSSLLVETVRLILFAQELDRQSTASVSLPEIGQLDAFWESILALLASSQASFSSATSTALWEALLTRWSFVLDIILPSKTMAHMSGLLVQSLQADQSNPATHAISKTVCQSADFQELVNWRLGIMAFISKQCQEGSEDDAARALSALVHFPLQYVPADMREQLLVKALATSTSLADTKKCKAEIVAIHDWLSKATQLSGTLSDKVASDVKASLVPLALAGKDDEHCRMLLEKWLAKLLDHQQITVEEITSLVTNSMLDSKELQVIVANLLIDRPTALKQSIDLPALRLGDITAINGSQAQSLQTMTQWLIQTNVALRLADAVHNKGSQSDAHEQAMEKAQESIAHIVSVLPAIDSESSTSSTRERGLFVREFLTLCSLLVSSSQPVFETFCVRVISGLSASLPAHLDGDAQSLVEGAFQRFAAQLTVEQYDHLLGALGSKAASAASQIGRLGITGLALRFGPEGTLLVAQKHFTRFLTHTQSVFCSGILGSEGIATVQGYLEAIAAICNGRAMVIRSIDAPLLLSICSSVVATSSQTVDELLSFKLQRMQGEDRQRTASKIFETMMRILNILVRLRKDVLLPILAQLAILLTQLPRLFIRPLSTSLHSAQTRRLVASFPQWLAQSFIADDSPTDWLSTTKDQVTLTREGGLTEMDARHFSRLLDTLISKTATLSRKETASFLPFSGSNASSATSGAVSLSRPFSKHAIYIILSYVHALLNPIPGSAGGGGGGALRAIIPPNVRRELLPGLQSLCGVINQSERDWVLVAELLDESGKNVFKDIWRGYEQAKYRGD
ncbi:unnamed protein product [Sympodiomycopsis kandeliae]